MGDTPMDSTERVVAYPPDAVLTKDEVARWLGMSERHLERQPIKRVTLGRGIVRYLASDVYAFLRARAA